MGEVMTRLQVFHRLGVFWESPQACAFIGTAVLVVRWRSSAIACLRAFGDSGDWAEDGRKWVWKRQNCLKIKKFRRRNFA